ncbi:unnamed protein product [Rhizophagus irregularis]|nr:unnamed protein product [Rhizophagus irregularis]
MVLQQLDVLDSFSLSLTDVTYPSALFGFFGRVEFGVSFSLWSLDIAGFLSAWESGRSDDQFFEYLNT